jgi:hypothetical protein
MSRAPTGRPKPARCGRPRSGCWGSSFKGARSYRRRRRYAIVRVKLGAMEHEVFAELMLDAQNRLIE